jgi:2-polyprenyl-3-methyl-5-hydroxy-6-metoxy-1,4-benzoquinol methylase
MNRLEKIAINYDSTQSNWKRLQRLVRFEEYNIFKNHVQDFSEVVEIGVGDGVFTEFLSNNFQEIVAIDGSKIALEKVESKIKNKNIKFLHCMIENLSNKRLYKNIVLSHVLEHLENPVQALKNISKIMKDSGTIYISVPNANSFHRQVAVEMGILTKVDELNEMDLKIGHKIVFSSENFKETIESAGFRIIDFGGIMLKPLTNSQIEQNWSDEMIKGFIKLGHKYPDLCGDIYVVAKLN